MKKIPRQAYAAMYGPTTGDKVRLADTELFIEVEKTSQSMVRKSSLVVAKLFAMAWDSLRFQEVMEP